MIKVLLPTDFSENARQAADYAFTLFCGASEFMLVHAFEVPHSGATMLISIADIIEKDSKDLLTAELDRLEEKFPACAGKIRTEALMGMPDNVLRRVADREKPDFVVMGTKGASGLKGVLVGSVASSVMQSVACPVLAIPFNGRKALPRKILFAADDKSLMDGECPAALKAVSELSEAEVMVLNVVRQKQMAGEHGFSASKPMNTFSGVRHSYHFVEGEDIGRAIDGFADEKGVDMIAMVRRKNDLFSNLFGRSETRQMIQHSRLPFLALPGDKD